MKTKLNLRVSFCTRSAKGQKAPSPIQARIALNGKRAWIGQIGLSVVPNQLVNNRVTTKAPKATEINRELEEIERKLHFHAEELLKTGDLSLESLKDAFLGKKVAALYVSSQLKAHLDDTITRYNTGRLSKGTLLKNKRFVETFLTFLSVECKRKDIRLKEITLALVRQYEQYLFGFCGYSHNTAAKYLRFVITLVRTAVERGECPYTPVLGLSYRDKETDRGFLTEEELQRISALDLSKEISLSITRDLFLFSCHTGISYKDLYYLNTNNLITIKGHPWIMLRRHKTDSPSKIYLLQPAIELINKYDPVRPIDGRLFPVFCNQVINRHLKVIADRAGITKRLTFHLARHTFATLSLTRGVSLETVGAVLGHKKLNTTRIYARIIPEKIERELSKLDSDLQARAVV